MSHDEGGRSPVFPNSGEISPRELADALLKGSAIQVMDVRAPERVAKARIEPVVPDRFHHLRGSDLMRTHEVSETGLDPDLPVVVVCGHGSDSKVLASHLGRMGLNAGSLAGGMVAWNRLTIPVELDPPEGVDRLVQLDRIGPGCLGYLLVSEGKAVAVDPPLHFQTYLDLLDASGAEMVGVADTHAHADYVSGGLALADRFNVPYFLHPADSVFPFDRTRGTIRFTPLEDGERVEFGGSALEILHTPGHTEGSVTFLVEGRLALTGDFLFVDSVGRPDLGGKAEEWAGRLWTSMARVIRSWDDGIAVYPGHYSGESERRMGRAVGASFGDLLRGNEILRLQDPDVFLRYVLNRSTSFPEAYRKIKAVNLGLASLSPSELEELEIGRNECALGGA